MQKMNLKLWLMALALVLVAGCAANDLEDPDADPADTTDVETEEERDREAFAAGREGDIDEEDLTEEERAAREAREAAESMADLRDQTVIYFDFDSSDIKRESRDILEAHAAYLASDREASVVLEGHTDERGTSEYNMALGERRAESVKEYLVINNVNRDQLEVVSYGEENPAVDERNEDAYAQNRRVEIVYD